MTAGASCGEEQAKGMADGDPLARIQGITLTEVITASCGSSMTKNQ